MVHSRRVMVARARPRASRSRAKLSMSARRTANRFREWARHQEVNWRKSSAYASRVSPRYPARNPARANRSASVKMGWIVASAVDGAAVVIGHLPAGLKPGGLCQPQVPAIERKPNVSRLGRSHHVTVPCALPMSASRDIRAQTEYLQLVFDWTWRYAGAQIVQFGSWSEICARTRWPRPGRPGEPLRVMADLDILADWVPEAGAAFPRSHRALLADRI